MKKNVKSDLSEALLRGSFLSFFASYLATVVDDVKVQRRSSLS
ncbi:hypothetical protein [Niastella populi]|nr:hypothetical protein [Niastella populi]